MNIELDQTSKLFFKIWRNKIILKNIFKFLKLFNIFKNYNLTIEYDNFVNSINSGNDIIYSILKENSNYIQKVYFIFTTDFYQNQLMLDYINSPIFLETVDTLQLSHPHHYENNYSNNSNNSNLKKKETIILNSLLLPNRNNQIKSLIINNVLIDENQIVIPNSVESLKISYDFDTRKNRINSGIPLFSPYSNLKTLSFGYSFSDPIKKNQLPETLENIYFPSTWNHYLEPGLLPIGLKIIHFGYCFNNKNQPLKINSIPENVKEIKFGSHFNQPLSPVGIIPPKVESIKFGKYFNQPLSNLKQKNKLINIIIKSSTQNYNSDNNNINNRSNNNNINNQLLYSPNFYLPLSLSKLEFSKYSTFNQKFKISNKNNNGQLNSLELSILNNKFEKLPSSLTFLKVNSYIPINIHNISLSSNHFKSLVKLNLKNINNVMSISETLPSTLKSLYLSKSIELLPNSLPGSIKILKGVYQSHLNSIQFNKYNVLQSIERMVCEVDDHDFSNFSNLKSIKFINKKREHLLPNSLKELSYGCITTPNQIKLPDSLTALSRFGGELSQWNLKQTPSSIKILQFKYIGKINESLLPKDLEILILIGNLSILELPLPPKLHTIFTSDSNINFFNKNNENISLLTNQYNIKILNSNQVQKIYKSIIKKEIYK